MSDNVEIGYLCSRGHFVFYDDPEYDGSCGSKRAGAITVTREAEFYPPSEEADETGFVYFADCGYSEQDYLDLLQESKESMKRRLSADWHSA